VRGKLVGDLHDFLGGQIPREKRERWEVVVLGDTFGLTGPQELHNEAISGGRDMMSSPRLSSAGHAAGNGRARPRVFRIFDPGGTASHALASARTRIIYSSGSRYTYSDCWAARSGTRPTAPRRRREVVAHRRTDRAASI